MVFVLGGEVQLIPESMRNALSPVLVLSVNILPLQSFST